MRPIKTHTIQAQSVVQSIELEVCLIPPFVTDADPYLNSKWHAVWDTGATLSCVTQFIADQLALTQIGTGMIYTATGTRRIKTYLVHILLPGDIKIRAEVAAIKDFGTETDVIIGMDIISQFDFAVSNVQGKTTFSYRYPSSAEIDLT